jgi:hypothetical protein
MIETILSNAGRYIQDSVSSVSLAGGSAVVLSVADGRGNVSKVPAVLKEGGDPCDGNNYTSMLPDDTQSAVVFWQVLDNQLVQQINPKVLHMRADCRLVVWCNLKRLNPANADLVMAAVIAAIQSAAVDDELSEDWVSGIFAHLEFIEHRNPVIFSSYEFKEAETQYITSPYDFRSARYDIRYNVLTSCLPSVAAVQPAC